MTTTGETVTGSATIQGELWRRPRARLHDGGAEADRALRVGPRRAGDRERDAAAGRRLWPGAVPPAGRSARSGRDRARRRGAVHRDRPRAPPRRRAHGRRDGVAPVPRRRIRRGHGVRRVSVRRRTGASSARGRAGGPARRADRDRDLGAPRPVRSRGLRRGRRRAAAAVTARRTGPVRPVRAGRAGGVHRSRRPGSGRAPRRALRVVVPRRRDAAARPEVDRVRRRRDRQRRRAERHRDHPGGGRAVPHERWRLPPRERLHLPHRTGVE